MHSQKLHHLSDDMAVQFRTCHFQFLPRPEGRGKSNDELHRAREPENKAR